MLQTVVIARVFGAIVFAVGAIHLAERGADGWGWCIVAALLLGCVSPCEVNSGKE